MDSYKRRRIQDAARRHNGQSAAYIASVAGASEAEVLALGYTGGSLFNPGPGQVGIDFDGDLDVGIGGGFGVDLSNGDLTFDGIDLG